MHVYVYMNVNVPMCEYVYYLCVNAMCMHIYILFYKYTLHRSAIFLDGCFIDICFLFVLLYFACCVNYVSTFYMSVLSCFTCAGSDIPRYRCSIMYDMNVVTSSRFLLPTTT